jgi:hypothetical protein
MEAGTYSLLQTLGFLREENIRFEPHKNFRCRLYFVHANLNSNTGHGEIIADTSVINLMEIRSVVL